MSDAIIANRQSAVLVVDIQQALVSAADKEKEVVVAINNIVQHAQAVNKLVIYIQHCHQQYELMVKGVDGWQIFRKMGIKHAMSLLRKLPMMHSIKLV